MPQSSHTEATGLAFERFFTKPGQSPYQMFSYALRSTSLRNSNGQVLSESRQVEVPSQWSQIATDVLAHRYLRKAGVPQADGRKGAENSARQVVHRMAYCWQQWGARYGYFRTGEDAQVFYDELVYMLLGQYAAPNSPQWFNTGLHETYGIKGKTHAQYYVDPDTEEVIASLSAFERPQPHACFILSVNKDLAEAGNVEKLLELESKIFRYGGGTGANFSAIPGIAEGQSESKGALNLMSVLKRSDRAAGAVKSGGVTRRAAKMICLDLDHPDVENFINWKKGEEARLAALIKAGTSSEFEGAVYQEVSGQNSNLSVRIPNAFFQVLRDGGNWPLVARTTGSIVNSVPARQLWEQIAEAAWSCADPGVQFDTTINEWHTCPAEGPIRASNPCSEYMFLDDTACNLASLNLIKFYSEEKQAFDVAAFEHACRLWTVVLDISVLMAQFPSPAIALRSYNYRTIGLGYANLGALLMVQGLPYDCAPARALAGAITSIMTGCAYRTSAEMAAGLGPFPKFSPNKEAMLRVIRNHRAAAFNLPAIYAGITISPTGLDAQNCPPYLMTAAQRVWDEAVSVGLLHGYRNAQATVIAPTGTIGLLMDCDTTGIEPDYALVKHKKLSGGGYFKIVNRSVPKALKNLGYNPEQAQHILQHLAGHASLYKAPYINEETLQQKGFLPDEIARLNSAIPLVSDLESLFSPAFLEPACLQRLGLKPEQLRVPGFSLLHKLGFSDHQLKEANAFVFGTGTAEGAPHLKPGHEAVFDCAIRSRQGTRYIKPEGHLLMMAAVQPFISGAISKTINLQHEVTWQEVAHCYEKAWQLGLKACSVYRDGSKTFQPLTSETG